MDIFQNRYIYSHLYWTNINEQISTDEQGVDDIGFCDFINEGKDNC